VIFEYKLPPQRAGAPYTATSWENDWHVLSTLPIGSPTYLTVLEGILDDVTAVGALPAGPNLGLPSAALVVLDPAGTGASFRYKRAMAPGVRGEPHAGGRAALLELRQRRPLTRAGSRWPTEQPGKLRPAAGIPTVDSK
jgi:hypothetical protein